jgi:hypothetical protein
MAGTVEAFAMPVFATPGNATIGRPAGLSASENGALMPTLGPETPPGESEPPSSLKPEPLDHTCSRISLSPLTSAVSQAT